MKGENKLPKNKKEIKDIEDNIQKADEKTDMIKQEEVALDDVKLEKIEEEIKKQTTIPQERKNKISRRIFKNLLIAIAIVVYFIFINMGYKKLDLSTYLTDLKVFSGITLGIAIVLFEIAYKNDRDETALNGIEILVLAIFTLLTLFILDRNEKKYTYIINIISMLFAIYYVGKSIVIYCKIRAVLVNCR